MLTATFWTVVFRCFGGFVGAVALFAIAWSFLGPEKPDVDPIRQMIAKRAIIKVAKELRDKRDDIKRVAVIHFVNDPTDHLTLSLRNELSASGAFNVDSTGFVERANNLLAIRNDGMFSYEEALEYGERNELDAVIIGRVEQFELVDEKNAHLTGEVKMIDVRTKNIVVEIDIDENSKKTFASQIKSLAIDAAGESSEEIHALSPALRLLIFVLATILLPIVTIALIRKVVSHNSNKENALMLFGYTFFDSVIAFFLIGGCTETIWAAVLFLFAIAAAFYYNLQIMSFALKLES